MEQSTLNSDNQENIQKNNSESKKWKSIIIALTIFSISAISYIFYSSNKNEQKIKLLEQKNKENISVITSEKDNISSELLTLQQEYESIKSLSQEKDQQIQEANNELENKKNELIKLEQEIERNIKSNKASITEIKNLKKLITDYKKQVDDYKEQIEQLKQENNSLKIENEDLNLNLDNEKIKTKQQEELISEGSTLNASNFKIEGLKVRKSGKEVETQRAKRIQKIRVTFTLDENRISKTETKKLYIAAILPNKNIASFKNSNNGTIVLKNGTEALYSDEINVMYNQGTKIPVSFNWDSDNFEKGTYSFIVYQNGYKIGEGSTVLK